MWIAIGCVIAILIIICWIALLEDRREDAYYELEDVIMDVTSQMSEMDARMVVEDLEHYDGEHTNKYLREEVKGVHELQNTIENSYFSISMLWFGIGVIVIVWILW